MGCHGVKIMFINYVLNVIIHGSAVKNIYSMTIIYPKLVMRSLRRREMSAEV